MKKLGISCVVLLALALIACGSAKVIAASSLAAVQTAVDSYLALYAPTWSGTQQLNDAFSKAISDVANWKSGTPGSDVQQALGDVAGILDSIPQINNTTDQAIAAAINFVDNMITIVTSESSSNFTDKAAFYAGKDRLKAELQT